MKEMLELEEKSKKAWILENKAKEAYELGDEKKGTELLKECYTLKLEVISEVDNKIKRSKSTPISVIKQKVKNKPKVKRISTGMLSLDRELVTEKMYKSQEIGGFGLGNFIQIAGSRGSGKTSILMKMLTGFSDTEKVFWADFEMGEDRVVEKLEAFKYNEKNILYYNSSRELGDIIDEIKFLSTLGVKHFVVDSAMKIRVKGIIDNVQRFSEISSTLSELTSTLKINIYLINQLSQGSEKDGTLSLKYGNDAEYDADFIFYIIKLAKMNGNKPVLDKFRQIVYEDDFRVVKCHKNRQDDRLFTVKIPKTEIFGISSVVEVEYQLDMPIC